MNIGSLNLMNILHFLKCCLFIISLVISLRVKEQWRKNNIIIELKLWNSTSSGNSEQDNKLLGIFFILLKFLFLVQVFLFVL